MAFYEDHVYPWLVDRLGDPAPIRRIRAQIIPQAEGDVLEIGAGSGANFAHYDARRVSKLYALEPNPGMIRLAARRLQGTSLHVEFLDLPGEQVPLPDQSIDTVVSTFTLCTIERIQAAILSIRRIVKPEGRLIFFELGLSPDPEVQRWQRRMEPLYHRLFQGLYLRRDIPSLLMQGGFRLEHVEEGYLARFPKSSSHCWWGSAVPSAAG